MTTHLPSQDEQSVNATSAMEVSQGLVPPQASAPQAVVLPEQPEPEEEFFYFEEEQPDLAGTPFIAPFQLSNAMPIVSTHAQQSGQSSASLATPAHAKQSGKKRHFSLTMIAILVCVVVIVGMLIMNVLVQTTPPLQLHTNGTSPLIQTPTRMGTSVSTPTGQSQGQGRLTPSSLDWVPQQLPDGWANAGLMMGDDLQALRTAIAFNDREMSLDYRSVGTRDHHAGTFIAATFILTPAAKQRFEHNDVRMMNNVLFDQVVTTKLIRVVINPQPQVVKFAQQGQQQFTWVDVSFQIWQSQIDPHHQGQRIEGKDRDSATNQPRIHHLVALLLRVPPEAAGANPAMGGTGWLVSNYALDQANGALPAIVQPA